MQLFKIKFEAANLEMYNKSQSNLKFGKFSQKGIFLTMLFLFFLGVSFSPISAQGLEIRNFKNQTAQFSAANSHKNPANGLSYFPEQIEEKEEEKQEDSPLDYPFDAIGLLDIVDSFVYSLISRTLKVPNSWIISNIPLYILFQNLKLDLV